MSTSLLKILFFLELDTLSPKHFRLSANNLLVLTSNSSNRCVVNAVKGDWWNAEGKKEVKYASEGTPVICCSLRKTYGCFAFCHHKSVFVTGMYGTCST